MRQSGRVKAIRQLASREVYRSRWLRVREDEVQFPSGVRGTYSVVDKPDFVLVIPYVDEGFWLVEQFRYPVGSREWEFPQGGWPSSAEGEEPDSDVDLMVEFEPGRAPSLWEASEIASDFSALFGKRRVDLVPPGVMRNPYRRKTIERDLKVLYEAK